MATTSSLTATAASSRPTLLKASPLPVLFLRPISRCCSKFRSVRTKATEKDQDEKKSPKVYSLVCKGCEGNGAISCTQCKGSGVNSEDHFNGRFKAGALCWLCRGKCEILCGSCNGAGFLGGIMSTADDTAM